jgi:hypothetical protein
VRHVKLTAAYIAGVVGSKVGQVGALSPPSPWSRAANTWMASRGDLTYGLGVGAGIRRRDASPGTGLFAASTRLRPPPEVWERDLPGATVASGRAVGHEARAGRCHCPRSSPVLVAGWSSCPCRMEAENFESRAARCARESTNQFDFALSPCWDCSACGSPRPPAHRRPQRRTRHRVLRVDGIGDRIVLVPPSRIRFVGMHERGRCSCRPRGDRDRRLSGRWAAGCRLWCVGSGVRCGRRRKRWRGSSWAGRGPWRGTAWCC